MDDVPHPDPIGVLRAVDGHVVFEVVNAIYQAGSICVANRGFDLDEKIERYDMQSLRWGSDPLQSESKEDEQDGENTERDADSILWVCAKG